jgi:hypothetical protein
MKIAVALLFLILVAVSPAFCQWKKNGESAADTPERKAVSGFGGHLIVVKNPREFIQDWLKPERPEIKTADEVKRGETIGVLVLFAGCKQDGKGECNSEVSYEVYKPDGSLYAERKANPLWKEKAPPTPNVQVGRAILAFRLGKDDAEGDYKVKAKVSDRNADISFELETKFSLK